MPPRDNIPQGHSDAQRESEEFWKECWNISCVLYCEFRIVPQGVFFMFRLSTSYNNVRNEVLHSSQVSEMAAPLPRDCGNINRQNKPWVIYQCHWFLEIKFILWNGLFWSISFHIIHTEFLQWAQLLGGNVKGNYIKWGVLPLSTTVVVVFVSFISTSYKSYLRGI